MYQADPGALPDDRFAAGDLAWLVAGNEGRLLDARRTPVRVTAVDTRHGYFEVEILAFEDTGARWLIPLEEVTRYQFGPDGARARPAAVTGMKDAIRRLDVAVDVVAGQEERSKSLTMIARERARADSWLTAHGAPDTIKVGVLADRGHGSPEAFRWLAGYLAASSPAGLPGMDAQLTASYVSNPGSGDMVRAHLITAARLGLCEYRGKAVRDESSLSGMWTQQRRAAHLVTRAAFTQALWSRADHPGLMVYRGIGLQADTELEARATALTSATLSRAVAESHFNSRRCPAAVLLRRRLPAERLFMTFLETPAMNGKYPEAEVVLFGNGRLL